MSNNAACPAAWLKFLSALETQGVTFEDIQFSDAKTREELIGDITANFSKLERAVVSSHWNKLNSNSNSQQGNSSSQYGNDGASLASPSSNRGQQQQQQPMVPHLGALSPGSAPPSMGTTPRDAGAVQNIGGYLVSNEGVSYAQSSGPFDPSALRAALNRGDATTALPQASEMLQKDPLALCAMLHEFAPHLSVATIKSILGLDGGPPGRGLPPAIAAATGIESPTRFGAYEGNDVASARKGGTPADGNSTVAMVNGQQVPVGQVLTSVSLSSQYGAGFSITCNGQLVHLPYCVQPGDRIIVTAAEVRI